MYDWTTNHYDTIQQPVIVPPSLLVGQREYQGIWGAEATGTQLQVPLISLPLVGRHIAMSMKVFANITGMLSFPDCMNSVCGVLLGWLCFLHSNHEENHKQPVEELIGLWAVVFLPVKTPLGCHSCWVFCETDGWVVEQQQGSQIAFCPTDTSPACCS